MHTYVHTYMHTYIRTLAQAKILFHITDRVTAYSFNTERTIDSIKYVNSISREISLPFAWLNRCTGWMDREEGREGGRERDTGLIYHLGGDDSGRSSVT